MGTVGDALDDAVAESFFATLQTELLDRHRWSSRTQPAQAIFERIEVFYNPQRRHSTLDMHPPITYAAAAHTGGTPSISLSPHPLQLDHRAASIAKLPTF